MALDEVEHVVGLLVAFADYIGDTIFWKRTRFVVFADFIGDTISWINDQTSLRKAVALLPEIATKTDGFHLYQVELVITRWARIEAAYRSFGLRQVAGPGMLPLMLSLVDRNEELDWSDYECQVFNALQDGEQRDHTRANKRLKIGGTTKKGTWANFRLAVCLCSYLTQILVSGNKFSSSVSRASVLLV